MTRRAFMLAAAQATVLAANDTPRPQVWIFTRTDCPISNRYAPAIENLYQTYEKQGIAFLLIYTEPGASAAAIEQHRKDFGLTMPYQIDRHYDAVRKAGVQVTPEAAVFARDGKLIYRGRIDDRQASLAVTRRGKVREDLAEVLAAIVNGSTPSFRSTKAFGCALERLSELPR